MDGEWELNAMDRTGNSVFTRTQLLEELPQMVAETGSTGKTPQATMDRLMQELRDLGEVLFVDDHGTYRRLR